MNKESLVMELFRAGCVQFGQFKLKSGLLSPIYIDLRLLISHPSILQQVARAMADVIQSSQPPLHFDRIAAIPYAALPIGVALSLTLDQPMIYPRKEVKSYGTARPIEGRFAAGETALLVDDLITRGESKLEALTPLTQAGLCIKDILVLIDRQQGGRALLEAHGYRLYSLLTLPEMLTVLRKQSAITAEQHSEVLNYLEA